MTYTGTGSENLHRNVGFFAGGILGGHFPRRPHCVAGHIGLELPNPRASYLIGFAWRFAWCRRKPGSARRWRELANQVERHSSPKLKGLLHWRHWSSERPASRSYGKWKLRHACRGQGCRSHLRRSPAEQVPRASPRL